MKPLTISLIQTDLYWENTTANLAMLEEKIANIGQKTDLIILSEMFNTAFTANTDLAEPLNLTTHKWLKMIAKQTDAVVVGSFMVKEDKKYYNRLIWQQPNGEYDFYDKRHLFRMTGENQVFEAGNRKIIKELKGWKICPLICYDLRFPVWSRNINLAYDLVLYVASWAESRINVWDTLLQARALENQCYVVGVNRIGTDANGYYHSGNSALIDFKGNVLFKNRHQAIIHTQTLDKQVLDDFRIKFPAYLDADEFTMNI